MTKYSRKVTKTFLECGECGEVQTIMRRLNRLKTKNHIKHMHCYKCKKITGHIEVKEDAFLPQWLRNTN